MTLMFGQVQCVGVFKKASLQFFLSFWRSNHDLYAKKEHAASSAASEFSKVFMAEFLCVDSFDLILPSIFAVGPCHDGSNFALIS